MGTITRLVSQKRNKERINIFLDGEYAFSLALASADGLYVGQTLTDEDVSILERTDSLEKAKQHAYRFLSYRPRSTAETQRFLGEKGYAEITIAKAIDRLAELGYLDDQAFARYWLEQRETFRPRSRIALRSELYQKGIDRDTIEVALADFDELKAARQVAQKKINQWSAFPREVFQLKIVQYLHRRGFDYAIIECVSAELLSQIKGEDD